MREIVSRNGSLRAGFFRDVRKVDRARKLISKKEIALLRDILREGKALGTFDVDNCMHTAVLIIHAIHGLDVPYIRDNLTEQGVSKQMLTEYISNIFLYGIKKR